MNSSDTLLISLSIDDSRWKDLSFNVDDLCNSAVRIAFLVANQAQYGEVSILLTNDPVIRGLNSRYRRRSEPTNVLSFSGTICSSTNDGKMLPQLWGDVVISFDRVSDEAKYQEKSVRDHVAHLIIHGTLHLLGFDHQEQTAAEDMEKLEILSLRRLGIRNPYQAKNSNAQKVERDDMSIEN